MAEDTVELLKECNSGIKMGVEAIDEVLGKIKNEDMRRQLKACKEKHERLGDETHEILNRLGEEDKEPNPVARGMSWMKTNVKMAMDMSDATAADLLTDGCNMGIKSINRYLNQYGGAEHDVQDIAHELIDLEEKTVEELQQDL